MEVQVTYKKINRETGEEFVKAFEMNCDEEQMNLPDGFMLINLEKSKTTITLEVWQGDQFLIDVCVTHEQAETLHLKFYDFDIYLSFELYKSQIKNSNQQYI